MSRIRRLVAKRVWHARGNPNDGARPRCDGFLAELDLYHALGHDHGFLNGISVEGDRRPFVHLKLTDEEGRESVLGCDQRAGANSGRFEVE